MRSIPGRAQNQGAGIRPRTGSSKIIFLFPVRSHQDAARTCAQGLHRKARDSHQKACPGFGSGSTDWPRWTVRAADKCDEFPSPHGFAHAKDHLGYERNITFWMKNFGWRIVPFVTPKRAAPMSALGQKRTYAPQQKSALLAHKGAWRAASGRQGALEFHRSVKLACTNV